MLKSVLVLCLASGARAADLAAGDEASLRRIVAAYEAAFNTDDLSKILPYIDKNFRGLMVTGDEVKSPADLRLFWEKVKRIIRQGKPDGSYRIQLRLRDFQVDGDRASARGTTAEEVRTGDGTVLKYQSVWSADLRKQDGAWRIAGFKSAANPIDKATMTARLVANRLWGSFFHMKLPGEPDYDGDGGERKREVLSD